MQKPPHKKLGAYKAVHVQTASPAKQVVMLYDGIVTHLRRAIVGFEEDSPERNEIIHNAIQEASRIIVELRIALDVERGGEVARGLNELYAFWIKHLSDANATKALSPVEEVLTMVLELRDSWDQAARIAQS